MAASGGSSSSGGSAGMAATGGTVSSGGAGPSSGGTAGSSGGTAPGSGGATTPVDGGSGGSGEPPPPATALVYTGGGTSGKGSIEVYRLTYATGALTKVDTVNAGANAGFLAIDVPRLALYDADDSSMRVRRFTLNPTTFVPSAAGDVGASGNPVHIASTKDGKFVLTAAYNEAKLEAFPVSNGTLGASLGAKSTGGQAHQVVLSPDERFVFVPCKAADRIERYAFDKATGALTTPPVNTPTAGGAGPRHFAFHPGGGFAYLVNELGNTVYAYSYTASSGALTELQRIDSLPDGFSGTSTGAEIVVSPSGKDVYASNRFMGQNGDIVSYRVGTDGKLTLNGHQSTGGRIPRSFAIDPTGRYVIAANQDSRTLAVLAVDGTGKLGVPKTTDLGLNPSYVGIVVTP